MGKIKKILEKELGSTQSVEVYPVTSIEAVYDENNERLDNIINRKNNETQKELKAEVARATNAESNLRETINNITEINENATSANIVTIDTIPNTSSSNVQQALNELFKNATELAGKFDKASIVQEPGDSEELVMSQKATTEIVRSIEMTANKLYNKKQNKYQDKINDIIFNGQDEYSYIDDISLVDLSDLAINENYYITPEDRLVAFDQRNVSDYIDVSNYSDKMLVFWLADYFKDAGCTLCFYDTNKKLLYTDRNYPEGPITLSTDGSGNNILCFVLLPGISYIRISFSKGNSVRLSVYDDKNETSKLAGLASLTKKGEVVDVLCNSSYKRLFYDDLTKTGGPFSSSHFYIHLNKGIYVRKIISYTELTDKFKIVRWDETLNNIITLYHATLTLDSKDNDKYIYSLSDGGYFVNTDDCYFVPKNSSAVLKSASSGEKNKVALYSNIEKGNERIFSYILLSYDLLFLSSDVNGENEKVEQEVDTIKVSGRFFREKKYVAFGDSITDANTGAEEVGLSYPNLVGRYFGFTTINLGTPGSTPHDHGTHMNLSDGNLARITSDTMLVTISGGTNGWVTSDDINTLDRNTSIGAFNYTIDYIRRVAPKCVIILCPMYARSENFIKDYERIAENKGVGLAPILNNSLINWRDDVKDSSSPLYHLLLRDGVHPTNYGAFRMAALIKEYARNFII